ncbi:hypothetical protein BGX24_002878 [Mortierella sp. AD032]|nr:hypothetical protein BGX24_002878 [Mortierella sp. AD032]
MSNNDLLQQLQYGNDIYYFCVYPGVEETQGVPFVLLKDIQEHFPEASTFMCGRRAITYMRDANYDRLMPLRFAHQPDAITIAETKSSMRPTEMLPESSPMPSPSSRTRQGFSGTSPPQLSRPNGTLRSTSISPKDKNRPQQSNVLFEDQVKAMKNDGKGRPDLTRSDFSPFQESLNRDHDPQQQLNNMQQHMPQMQQHMPQMQRRPLDRLAVIQGRIQAILTQTYELHEYPTPRLFIILPKDTSGCNPASLLNNQFQLYFLCECGEHTKALSGDNANNSHHIHIAKHKGYDLQRPTEFFQKYGRYMLTLLEMIKYGVTFAGFASPTVAAVGAPAAMDMFQKSLDSISHEHDAAKDTSTDSFAGREALEGADIRHLEVFIKNKDQDRALGNLYRTISEEGHVKWVCIDHYRVAYKKQDQQAFLTAVELIGGQYDQNFGRVTVRLGSKILAAGFFEALVKARGVDELIVAFDWGGTTSDLETFGDTLKSTAISILRLDIRRFRTSLSSRLQSTYTRQQTLTRWINLPSVKMIHIVLPMDLVELSGLQQKRISFPLKISFEVVPGVEKLGKRGLKRLVEILKTNSTLTTLELKSNWIGDNGAVALAEALKTNSTLTTLDLSGKGTGGNGIGGNGAVALSEALKTNSTLTSLNLYSNSIGDKGAVALSEALKTNSTLTTLKLSSVIYGSNSIWDNGVVALSEALKTNSTLTTLDLSGNEIESDLAVTLSEAFKANAAIRVRPF